MDIGFIMEVEARAAALDGLDYFEVLRVPQDAAAADVKAAYYRESRAYHPDRYAALQAPELRDLIGRIYRRVNEAYTVLRDDAKRRRYLGDVTGPERAKKLRFTEAEESALQEEQQKKVEEQLGTTPNGRKLYAAALKDVEAQRWDGAERSLKAALMYEPANARFKELLAKVEKSKPKVDPYKIR
ncbi:MAG TPA: DnaJ domain-containing protein [Anaeromyxobacteraceae bacterium]